MAFPPLRPIICYRAIWMSAAVLSGFQPPCSEASSHMLSGFQPLHEYTRCPTYEPASRNCTIASGLQPRFYFTVRTHTVRTPDLARARALPQAIQPSIIHSARLPHSADPVLHGVGWGVGRREVLRTTVLELHKSIAARIPPSASRMEAPEIGRRIIQNRSPGGLAHSSILSRC